MRVAVMSPTYNERDNVDEFLQRVLAAVPTADVYIVDDNSPDGTGQRVRELSITNPQIHLITRSGERGYAAASREGLVHLADNGYDAIVTIDCDLSHDARVIPTMLARLESGASVVIGSRYVPGGGVRDWSLFRRLLSRWGNRYTALMLGIPVHDCTSGFRTYQTDVIKSGEISATVSDGYAFLSETLMRLQASGKWSIVEVPILYTNRVIGISKMNKKIIGESMRRVTTWGLKRFLLRRIDH